MSIASSTSAHPRVVPSLLRRHHAFASIVVAGLLAIGASGLVCQAIGSVFGERYLSGDSQSASLSAERCADLFEYHPHAGSCARAELLHHFDEVVEYRIAAGVLGLVSALAYGALRFTWLRNAPETPVERRFRLRAGAGLFAAAAVLLYGAALARSFDYGLDGFARWLSDGTMSLAAALIFVATLARASEASR
jgi:hypothetical protein